MKAIVVQQQEEEPVVELEDLEGENEDESTYAQQINITKKYRRVGRFETFVNLTNALLGAGIVNIPSTFVPCGLSPTFISLMFVCLLCYISGNILIYIESELHVSDMSQLALVVFGRAGEIISNILTNIFTFSCTASYLMIGTDQIRQWLIYSGVKAQGRWTWSLIAAIYSLILPVGLTIPKKMTFLSNFAYVITVILIGYCILIIGFSVHELFFTNNVALTAIGYGFNTKAFTAFSIHISTFALPLMMLPIITSYNPSVDKRKTVTGIVYIFIFCLVSFSGCFSYLISGEKTKPDFLMSFENKEVVIIILQIAIFISVTLTYPFVVRTIMLELCTLLYDINDFDKATTKQRLILVPAVNIVNIILAVFISDSSVILGFGGALSGSLMCFAFPSLCRLKTTTESFLKPRNIAHLIFVIFGCVSAIVCTVFNVMDLIQSAKHHST